MHDRCRAIPWAAPAGRPDASAAPEHSRGALHPFRVDPLCVATKAGIEYRHPPPFLCGRPACPLPDACLTDDFTASRIPFRIFPLACPSRCVAEPVGARARALHVGSHGLRFRDPDQRGFRLERGAVLRGLLFPAAPAGLAGVRLRCGDHIAARAACAAGPAQVPGRLAPVPYRCAARQPAAPWRHHVVVRAGGDRLRDVLSGAGTPLRDVHAPRTYRPV